MSARMTGFVFCGLAMVTVGSTVVASKLIAAGLPPFTATALRFAIAFPILAVLMHATKTGWPNPGMRDCLLLVLQAASGSVGYTVLLIGGMALTSAVAAGTIAGTLPAVAAIFAVVVLGERMHRRLLLATSLAVAGVLAVTFRPGLGGADFDVSAAIGNALVLGAIVCEAVFILLNRMLRVPVAPLALSTLMTGIGLVLSAAPALLERPWTEPIDITAFGAVAYYALVPTVGGFLLWYAGSMRISGSEASLTTALAPVSAVVLAAAVLAEPIGMLDAIGIACVTCAVALGAPRQGPSHGSQAL